MRRKARRLHIPLNATTVATTLGILIVIDYSAYVALPFIKGPLVVLHPPGQTLEGTVYISGSTERVSKLLINELEVPLSDTGTFAVERAYPAGYTVVIIQASDRFGRTRSETLTFVTQPHASKKEVSTEESSSEGDGESVEN